MLELAQDEQLLFIEAMKKKAFRNKKTSKNPTFTALIGAQGSGKSTLASQMKDVVTISIDDTVSEYAKVLGIDIREDFFDEDIAAFAISVNHQIIKDAIKNKYNIAYDTSNIDSTFKMIDYMEKYDYQTQTKVVLADEYLAAMNVVERKLNMDDKYTEFRQGQRKFPKGNVLSVMPTTSLNVSDSVAEFVQKAIAKNIPIEIYEFGKKEPSFKTGDDFDKFIDGLETISDEKLLERAENLVKQANKSGNEETIVQMISLRNKLRAGK